MFMLSLQVTTVQHGVVTTVDLLTKAEGTFSTYYDVFQLPAFNSKDLNQYALLVNYNASKFASCFVCSFSTYDECMDDPNRLEVNGQKNMLLYKNIYKTILQPYIMFVSVQINTTVQITFQAEAEIVLQYSPTTVDITEESYVSVVDCAQKGFKLQTNDPTAEICSSSESAHSFSSCQTGKLEYVYEESEFYNFFTIKESKNKQIQLQLILSSSELKMEKTNQINVFLYPLCYSIQQITSAQDFTLVQDVKSAERWGSARSYLLDASYNQLEEQVQIVQKNTKGTAFIVTFLYSDTFQVRLPYDDEADLESTFVWLVPSTNLTTLQNHITECKPTNYVLINEILNWPVTFQGNLDYELTFTSSALNVETFYVTDKYGTIGDACVDVNFKCQLKLNDVSQITAYNQQLYYVVQGDVQQVPNITYSPVFILLQNTRTFDTYSVDDNVHYFQINVMDLTDGLFYVVGDKNATITIVASGLEYLPNESNAQSIIVTNQSRCGMKLEASFMSQFERVYFKVVIESVEQISAELAFLSSSEADYIIGSVGQVYNLYTEEEVTFGSLLPQPIVGVGFISYFDAITFQAALYSDLVEECTIELKSYDNLISYGNVSLNNSFVTHTLFLSSDIVNNSDFAYVKAISKCNSSLYLAAVPVHYLGDQQEEFVPGPFRELVYMREYAYGVDYRIGITTRSSSQINILACSQPYTEGFEGSGIGCQNFSFNGIEEQQQYFQVQSQLMSKNTSFVYIVIISSEQLYNIPISMSEVDLNLQFHDIQHTTLLNKGETEIDYFTKSYNEQYFMLAINQIDPGITVCLKTDINTDFCNMVTEEQIISFEIEEYQNVYVIINSNADGIVSYQGYFFNRIGNASTLGYIQQNIPIYYVYKRTDIANKVTLTVSEFEEIYNKFDIPPSIFEEKISIFVNQKAIPSWKNFKWGQYQAGTQAVIINDYETTNDQFLIAVVGYQQLKFKLSICEKPNQYYLEYGQSKQIDGDGQVTDFILDSAYLPTGIIVETCAGKQDIALSYYDVPSHNYSMSQAIKLQQVKYGQTKSIMKSTAARQNFFASINASTGSKYILHHAYTDNRPTISDPTIRITYSGKDGFLTIQVDPATYTGNVAYLAYIISTNSTNNNMSSCGMMGGDFISDKTYLIPGNTTVEINTTIALNDTKVILNVIAKDQFNPLIGAAYAPITAFKGMDLINPDFDKGNNGKDLTWIIYVVLGVIIIITILLVVYFVKKRRQYVKISGSQVKGVKLQGDQEEEKGEQLQ